MPRALGERPSPRASRSQMCLDEARGLSLPLPFGSMKEELNESSIFEHAAVAAPLANRVGWSQGPRVALLSNSLISRTYAISAESLSVPPASLARFPRP